ncbi:FAD-dependent oxidoreductase [Spongiactinospora sp. TRM90649]|uniref:FAD-dependent oxidoreductase n=1 Tax=Spongiactinospora sp. TRM90649 TaxID=3031114 RepID=UPI0023F8E98D|nr:FAD-dependent oxidoreductase [Spongiactinospora sp. TRM90649]MDF5759098.1 FAD-dependent monooxygenase [Spongiactinospora sp. TRM90649]
MKALICGAGIAGLTLAWHLERAGWEVEVVERSAVFRDGGYMIDFYGAGLEVADRMGLADRLREVRHPVSEIGYVDRNGRQTSRLAMGSGFDGVISLLRGDLARIIRDDTRAEIRYATSVAEIRPGGEAVTVGLTDGTTRTVDLLVGADGVHSTVRGQAFGPGDQIRYLGHHVAAYTLTDARLSRLIGPRYRMLTVPGRMAGGYALGGDRLAVLFLRAEPDPEPPRDPVAALREHFGDLGWILPGVLRAEPADIYYDQVSQVEASKWSHGRVALLGDACQAVSLFAGHGASMAMAAAWVMADELAATPGDVPGSLGRYERRMRPVIAEVQAFGRRFIRWMAPPSRFRIAARDGLLRLAGLPGMDRLFLSSLTPGGHGLITGRSATDVTNR